MLRRCLTAVFVVGYLACQMASIPHAHAHQSADHDVRAHVHWDWFAGPGQHGGASSHESHARHGHEHDGHSHDHSNGERPSVPTPTEPAGGDHDSTSVYVPNDEHVSASTMPIGPLGGELTAAAVPFDDFASMSQRPSLSFHAPPEDFLVGGCALIVRLRTLRI